MEQNITEDVKKVGRPPKETTETVVIDKIKLESLLNRLDRLEASASKAALQHFDEKNKADIGKTIRIRTYNGKIVTDEKLIKNIVEKSPSGVWREEQELEITFDDGTKEKVPFVFYARGYKHIKATCIGEMKNTNEEEIENKGEFVLKVRFDDGKTMEIGSKFVN